MTWLEGHLWKRSWLRDSLILFLNLFHEEEADYKKRPHFPQSINLPLMLPWGLF